MSAQLSSGIETRIALLAMAPNARLAAEAVAGMIGQTVEALAARMAEAPGPLATLIDPALAGRVATILRLFGLRVEVTAGPGAPHADVVRYDMALVGTRPDGAAARAAGLSLRLGRSVGSVAAALDQPGGLVLRGLDVAAVGVWRRELRGLPGLRIVVSDPEAAIYDLMPWSRPRDRGQASALLRHLRRLGVGGCPVTGAIAAGLDRRMRDHLMTRYPAAGVIALNRDFQRFDLVMVAATGLSATELADFLTARCGSAQVMVTGADTALRVERALGRADALAFQSDYAAIGIETRLRLAGTDTAPAD